LQRLRIRQDDAGEADCGGGEPAGGDSGDASLGVLGGVSDGVPDGVSCGGCVWIGGTLDFFWFGR
jgi:hypothetical protein